MSDTRLSFTYSITPQRRGSAWEDISDNQLLGTIHLDWKDEDNQGVIEDAFNISQVEARHFLNRTFDELDEKEKEIVDAKLKLGSPTLELRITLECDNHCVHCFTTERQGTLGSFVDLKPFIDNSEPGCHITLTGGEPTLHPQLFQIIKYIKVSGRTVSLQTNAKKFADPLFANTLGPLLHTVQIPIHSADRATFNRIAGAADAYDLTMKAIGNLYGKTRIATQTVINKFNYRELLNIGNMIQEVAEGATMVITFPQAYGSASSTAVVPTYEEIHPYLLEYLTKWASKTHTHYIPPCYMYPFHDEVSCVDLGTPIHSHLTVDNREGKLISGDNSDVVHSYIKSRNCSFCTLSNICPGIPSNYIEVLPYEFDPPAILFTDYKQGKVRKAALRNKND